MGQALSGAQKKRQRALRSKNADNDYIRAISDPVFLDWEHRITNNDKDEMRRIEGKQQQFPIQIDEHLYLSNACGVSDLQQLKSLGISHVLNVAGPPAAWRSSKAYFEVGIAYKIVDAVDEPSYPMLENHLSECLEFIALARSQPHGKCVVHCQAGSNRSGVIVATAYMLHRRSNVLETILHCRKCRGNGFLTNPGFQGQLVALARREKLLGPAPGTEECVVEQWLWRKVKRENDL
jgi:Dual specificity phosphatase, catalytic domain